MVGGLALGLSTAALAGMPAQAIDSNPPTGPGNVEIFTKRDMVAIEGYAEYAGRTAEISVTRDGTVIGSARGVVDGTGFLEVNHPGGSCWGEGTTLKVTPDIEGGDQVRVDFLNTGGKWDGATVQDVKITEVIPNDQNHTLTLRGEYGPGVDMPGTDLAVDPGRFGVEIVNPDMRGGTSAIGERAIGWPGHVPDPTDPEPPPTGYTVEGSVTGTDAAGGTFAVTYDFETASDLDLALAGEHVALAWQANHPDPNQEAQFGLTMWENGESSGPGFGGCPAGPQDMRPDGPTVATATGGDGSVDVTWNAGSTQPGAAPIEDYTITAIRPFDTTWGGGVVRVPAGHRTAQVVGLTPNEVYDIEIEARSDAGDSKPVTMRVRTSPHTPAVAEANTEAPLNADGRTYSRPLVTTETVDYGVHLDAVDAVAGARIYYTVDGSAPSETSTPYQVGEPLQIRSDTTVKWVIYDAGNVKGMVGEKTFDIEMTNTPPTPNAPTAVGFDAYANVSFNVDPAVTALGYRVQAYSGDIKVGTPLGVPLVDGATSYTRKVPNLVNGTQYTFTLAVRVGNAWSNESARSNAVTPTAAPKANAGADQTVLRGREFTLDATGSVAATSYQWTQIRPASNGTFPQDPVVDLDPTKVGAQAASPVGTEPTKKLVFPLLTTPTSDHNLRFRLTTTHSNGTTVTSTIDTVDITGLADTVTAEEVRWRAGDEIEGTGSQENARLTFLNGSPTGSALGAPLMVTNGAWSMAAGTPALVNGRIYVWSNYGFTGYITTTN